jgi:hypothetical protein
LVILNARGRLSHGWGEVNLQCNSDTKAGMPEMTRKYGRQYRLTPVGVESLLTGVLLSPWRLS